MTQGRSEGPDNARPPEGPERPVGPERPDGSARQPARSFSAVLLSVANENRERVSIGDIEAALRGRSFGPFLVVFALPNLLPLPPGTSTLLGLPLLAIGWQLTLKRREVWLGRFLRRRSMSHGRYRRLLARALPRLRMVERAMQPRQWPFAPGGGQRVIGLFVLLMAILTVIPLPFANWLPAAACLCTGVALTARDGVWLGIGVGVGAVALAVFFVIAFVTTAAVNAVAA